MNAPLSLSGTSRFVTAALSVTAAAALMLGAAALPARAETAISKTSYTCKGGKTINAVYYADKVHLALSDGRTMTLPQTMSGSGIRYANADESFVFWSKGLTAFVDEGANQQETYSDCVAPHL